LEQKVKNSSDKIDLSKQVVLRGNIFQLNPEEAVITIRLDPAKNQKLDFQCSACTTACEHSSAAFFLYLKKNWRLALLLLRRRKSQLKALPMLSLLNKLFPKGLKGQKSRRCV